MAGAGPADRRHTERVLASFDDAADGRFREIARSLVRHLHAFAEDVGLTEDEWWQGIDFLTRTGHITDERRQEFVLLSDVLGLSMLVIGLNHPAGAAGDGTRPVTESTVFGPFFLEGSPYRPNGGDVANGAPGEPMYVSGRVLTPAGDPVPEARIEVWEADADGYYDSQYPDLDQMRGRGHLYSDAEGRFWFWSVRPVGYPIPADGPVGRLLDAAARSPMRPAHVHFMIEAAGFRTLITHLFARGDPHLGSDAVFAERDSLVVDVGRHEPGTAPDGTRVDVPFHSLSYDFVLMPSGTEGRAG